MRIAVLENETDQANFLRQTLSSEGHTCHTFSSGRVLLKEVRRQTFDLLILDWEVPDVSGNDVLRWVRESLSDRLPVLFITGHSRETDISSMLDAGADDYIIKPVSPVVLRARVKSLLRRAYQIPETSTREVFDDIEFDLASQTVFVRGVPIVLMQKQFELALLLFHHISRPLSRAYITEVIWKQAFNVQTRTIDTHVSTLRAKLGLRPENGYRLTPIYGYGYRLEKIDKTGE